MKNNKSLALSLFIFLTRRVGAAEAAKALIVMEEKCEEDFNGVAILMSLRPQQYCSTYMYIEQKPYWAEARYAGAAETIKGRIKYRYRYFFCQEGEEDIEI